jgi:hypothetical protein
MNLSPHRAFALLLFGFIVLALAYSVVLPLGEAPDEVSHWGYVQYLVQHRQLPTAEGTVAGEAYQPPLYYLLGALATFWIPQSSFPIIANPDFVFGDPQTPNLLLHSRNEQFPYRDATLAWHLVRVLSIVLGAVTVTATWRIARAILPDEHWLAFGAAAFVAFLPGLIALAAVVNNDNLVTMLAALVVLCAIQILETGSTARNSIWLGILLGCALLTKLSGLVLWIFAAIVLGYRIYQTRDWKTGARNLGLCFGIAGILAAPWLIDNVQKYGDPLAWSLYLVVGTVRPTPMTLGEWSATIPALLTSFWGRLGGMLNLQLADGAYVALTMVAALALLGWLGIWRAPRSLEFSSHARRLFAMFIALWIPLSVIYFQWARNDYAPDQARRLFVGLPLLALMFVAGIAQLAGAHKQSVLGVWSGGWFALSVSVLIFLQQTYSVQPFSTWPLGGTNVPADFGKTIRIVDYHVMPLRVAPGKTIEIQIQWQALAPSTDVNWLLFKLANADGFEINHDGVPANGQLTTDRWQSGQQFFSWHRIVIPPDAPPGTYTLKLGVHPFGRWDWLPVRGQEMLTLGTILLEPNQK